MQNDTKGKRMLGAALSALVMGGLMLVITLCMLFDYFSVGGSTAETVVILLSAVVFLAIVVGVLIAFLQRRREIQGGEEDEARKY